MKTKVAFFNKQEDAGENSKIGAVYGLGRYEKIAEMADLYPHIISADNFEEHVNNLQDLEVIFSTWGMPQLTEEQVARLPNLKCVFYAAGASRGWRMPYLNNNVKVATATPANAIPVAEFCLGQILLSMKGFFRNSRNLTDYQTAKNGKDKFGGPGCYGETVALIGEGAISRKLQELLKPFDLNIMVVSSYLDKSEISLEEAFEKAYVISSHLPNLETNKGVLNGELFKRMRQTATFINTARGAQVNHDDLIEVFRERQDLTALLDVQHPEPPEEGSELYTLPNVYLSSHIAGSHNDEFARMADFMIADFQRWQRGEELLYEVDSEQL